MLVVHFDGLCEPRNPRGVATWAFVVREGDRVVHRAKGLAAVPLSDQASSNVAEYTGLLKALLWLKEQGLDAESVVVRGDSRLVVHGARGAWRVTSPRTKPFNDAARDLVRTFADLRLEHVPRGENAEADRLTEEAFEEALAGDPALAAALAPELATERQLAAIAKHGGKARRFMSRKEAGALLGELRATSPR